MRSAPHRSHARDNPRGQLFGADPLLGCLTARGVPGRHDDGPTDDCTHRICLFGCNLLFGVYEPRLVGWLQPPDVCLDESGWFGCRYRPGTDPPDRHFRAFQFASARSAPTAALGSRLDQSPLSFRTEATPMVDPTEPRSPKGDREPVGQNAYVKTNPRFRGCLLNRVAELKPADFGEISVPRFAADAEPVSPKSTRSAGNPEQ